MLADWASAQPLPRQPTLNELNAVLLPSRLRSYPPVTSQAWPHDGSWIHLLGHKWLHFKTASNELISPKPGGEGGDIRDPLTLGRVVAHRAVLKGLGRRALVGAAFTSHLAHVAGCVAADDP